MASYSLADLKAACEKYLRTRPYHSHGFCWWAYRDAEDVSSDEVYSRISPFFYEYRKLHPEIGLRPYVSIEDGCVPERVAFVTWMLEQIA